MESFQWFLKEPCKLYFQHHELLQLAALPLGNQRENESSRRQKPRDLCF